MKLVLLVLAIAVCFAVIVHAGVSFSSAVHLRVTTIPMPPYVERTSDGRFRGFVVELLERLAGDLKFSYDVSVPPDGSYGHKPHGSWDGMVGQLIDRSRDLAAASMFVTVGRREVVDFTEPFLNVYATVLLRKPSLWGVGHAIRSAADLLEQTDVAYGTLNRGILYRAFQLTENATMRRLFENMQRTPRLSFTRTNEQGIQRVRNEPFAFILPSTIGDYVSTREPCDLVAVDRFLTREGYAFAVPRHSPLRQKLNDGLRTLRESGFIDGLYRKWWYGTGDCSFVAPSHYRVGKSVSSSNSARSTLLVLVAFVGTASVV